MYTKTDTTILGNAVTVTRTPSDIEDNGYTVRLGFIDVTPGDDGRSPNWIINGVAYSGTAYVEAYLDGSWQEAGNITVDIRHITRVGDYKKSLTPAAATALYEAVKGLAGELLAPATEEELEAEYRREAAAEVRSAISSAMHKLSMSAHYRGARSAEGQDAARRIAYADGAREAITNPTLKTI